MSEDFSFGNLKKFILLCQRSKMRTFKYKSNIESILLLKARVPFSKLDLFSWKSFFRGTNFLPPKENIIYSILRRK
jgi:hypothetical protein